MGVDDQIKKAFQGLIVPELHAVRGDIRMLDQKIDGVDARLTVKMENPRLGQWRRLGPRDGSRGCYPAGVMASPGGSRRE